MKKEKRILFLTEGKNIGELATVAKNVGFEPFDKESWLRGGAPYTDQAGNEFFQCLVTRKGEPVAAFVKAFPKAKLLAQGHEFRTRASFEHQLLGLLGCL